MRSTRRHLDRHQVHSRPLPQRRQQQQEYLLELHWRQPYRRARTIKVTQPLPTILDNVKDQLRRSQDISIL